MNINSRSKITGVGAYVPQRKLTNHDLESMVDTTDEWITRRTGVKERRLAGKEEFASDLAIKAVENLIAKYDIRVDDVDMVIVTTFTADHLTPSVSAIVQGHFDMKQAGTMDLNAACTGFVYGLCVADSLITAGHSNKVLVVASEVLSKIVDYSDRNTCILFGDAAAAMLLERAGETSGTGSFLASYFTSDGTLAPNITCSNLSETVNGQEVGKTRLFQQEGKFLYEYVVKNIPEGVYNLLGRSNLTLGDIQWFVPHSANLRMIKALCERLNFPLQSTLISNELYGNTSSASIPLAIWLALEESSIKTGDKMILYGFGAGLTHGGVVIEW
ncbi:ketoacyl-ACP synthase III [Acetonema longum]|uniref:Beta-ketoacyl-[acyl-carrier-protein] synthase III n=1 Tax=Acetonema longum DSM 6540 TaxID=1009370 RepID=F7NER5_9FIRM|nr:ketoacyl-ACP synthase III [Acetonema longum]EGO65476.1 3-oxoacyl-(acyl carrier protein) synthase III [Acetonema longum DSM 6540]